MKNAPRRTSQGRVPNHRDSSSGPGRESAPAIEDIFPENFDHLKILTCGVKAKLHSIKGLTPSERTDKVRIELLFKWNKMQESKQLLESMIESYASGDHKLAS